MRLSSRERFLARLLAITAGLAAFYLLILSPLMEWKDAASSRARENMKKLMAAEDLYGTYRSLKKREDSYDRLLNNNMSVTSLVEESAKRLNILDRKSYTRESPARTSGSLKKTTTSVKFESLSSEDILRLLQDLENASMLLDVSYLNIRQAGKASDRYDLILRVESWSRG